MEAGLWYRLRRVLEARVRQRVTRAGLLFTVAIIMVALAAFVSANNLLFLLFAMMLATFLISGFVSRLTLAGLEVDFALPEHISAKSKVSARITVHNEKGWMTSFSVSLLGVRPSVFSTRLYFPAIPGSSAVNAHVEVEFARRGAYRENGFEFSTRFPFGFTERRIQVSLRRDVLVYPSIEPREDLEDVLSAVSGDIESRQRGRGVDFYRIRPYEWLESARHVDWKATAHTGEMQVREFAREQDPLVEIFLDLEIAEADERWFERAVEGCALLAWSTSQRECRVRFRTQDFELSTPVEGDVYAILRHLALVSPRRAAPLPERSADDGYHILFTTRPDAANETGWYGAHVMRFKRSESDSEAIHKRMEREAEGQSANQAHGVKRKLRGSIP